MENVENVGKYEAVFNTNLECFSSSLPKAKRIPAKKVDKIRIKT